MAMVLLNTVELMDSWSYKKRRAARYIYDAEDWIQCWTEKILERASVLISLSYSCKAIIFGSGMLRRNWLRTQAFAESFFAALPPFSTVARKFNNWVDYLLDYLLRCMWKEQNKGKTL